MYTNISTLTVRLLTLCNIGNVQGVLTGILEMHFRSCYSHLFLGTHDCASQNSQKRSEHFVNFFFDKPIKGFISQVCKFPNISVKMGVLIHKHRYSEIWSTGTTGQRIHFLSIKKHFGLSVLVKLVEFIGVCFRC